MRTMRIEHLAIWTKNLEAMRQFYETYFGAVASDRYENVAKVFGRIFLRFESGARLELMSRTDIADSMGQESIGYAHLAMSVGSEEAVNALTKRLEEGGFRTADGPRWTGDGYYESVIIDAEGNRIEITV
jgi:lactoylglutathione lyase